MFPRIILGEDGSGVLSLPGSVSFSFLRLHLAFSLLLRHLAFSSNVFSITPFKWHAALSHRRRSQSKPQERGKKKKTGIVSRADSLTTDGGRQHPVYISASARQQVVQHSSSLLSKHWLSLWENSLTRWLLAHIKTKQKVQIHTFDSGLFLRQKRKWKFPSVKLPPAIRPLISGVIFSFCFFVLMWRKILFNNRFRSYYPAISDRLVSVGGKKDLNRKR